MRTITVCGVIVTTALAAPAAQAKPKPDTPPKAHPEQSRKCGSHAVGFRASGALVSQALTQTAGADTPDVKDDRYSGTVVVTVRKANHGAPTGEQTYTLVDGRVRFSDAAPAAGDRVRVKGKITKLARTCDRTGFVPTISVGRVDFR